MVALMAALHALAAPGRQVFALLALVFAAMTAGVTSAVHWTVLAGGVAPSSGAMGWNAEDAFRWPSAPYALDILAWDLFFPLSAFSAAFVFEGSGLARAVRVLLVVSAVLALAGLAGVPGGNMAVRNLGILGYGAAFPLAALLVGVLMLHSAR